MSRSAIAIATTVILAIAVSAFAAAGDEWTDLFNGKDLTGWTNPYEWGEAKVIDGELPDPVSNQQPRG